MDSVYQFEIKESIYNQLRVALYPRVSSDPQAGEEKASIGEQLKEMRAVAKQKGWNIVGSFEEDCSGSILFRERPEGSKIMEMIENNEVDLIMLWDNDRLGRDINGLVAKIARTEFREFGIQVYSVHQPVEIKPREIYHPYDDDSSLWLESVTDAASSDYIRKFKRRHKMGMEKRIMNGRITGTPPIGYKVISVNDPLGSTTWRQKRIVDDDYAPLIKRIFDEYEQGASFTDIVRKLNIDGIKTPSRFSKKGEGLINGDRLWTSTTIKGIITNPTYYGAAPYYKDKSVRQFDSEKKKFVTVRRRQPMENWLIVENAEHPKIIEKEQWINCQKLRKSKASFGRHYGESHLLSGLIRHGLCGHAMHKSGGWGGGYFVCNWYWKTGRTQCKADSIRLIHLQKYVFEYVVAVSKNKNTLPYLKIEKDKGEITKLESERKSYISQLDKVSQRRRIILEAFENGTYNSSLFQERIKEHEDRKVKLEEKLKETEKSLLELSKSKEIKESAVEILDQFENRFLRLPLKYQKVLLRQLIQSIEITEKQIRINFNI